MVGFSPWCPFFKEESTKTGDLQPSQDFGKGKIWGMDLNPRGFPKKPKRGKRIKGGKRDETVPYPFPIVTPGYWRSWFIDAPEIKPKGNPKFPFPLLGEEAPRRVYC